MEYIVLPVLSFRAAFSGPVGIAFQPQSHAVMELDPVTFTVGGYGSEPINAQWFRNNVPIPGATDLTLRIPSVALTNHGATYKVVLTNTFNSTTYMATSSNAVLSVTADTTKPELLRAISLFPGEVLVTYSEGVRTDTALNPVNYVITRAGGSLPVTSARLGGKSSEIILTTGTQTLGTNYTLTVNGVRDLAAAANLIATNSQASFIATPFLGVEIGSGAADSSDPGWRRF